MNYAAIKKMDVANGPGLRVSLFVSGCRHHCPGCFNQEAWDFDYGTLFTEETWQVILTYLDSDYISGLSILGGEPMEQENQIGLLPFLNQVKQKYPNKSIWCYTGYNFETDILGDMCNKWNETSEFLDCISILVDGRFIAEKKDLTLRFRGSLNQRIICVNKSLKAGRTIEWEG